MLYSLFILFSAVSLLFFALFIALPYADEISDVFNLIFLWLKITYGCITENT